MEVEMCESGLVSHSSHIKKGERGWLGVDLRAPPGVRSKWGQWETVARPTGGPGDGRRDDARASIQCPSGHKSGPNLR